MGNGNKIPESSDITSTLLGLVGVGVAILVTKIGKELAIATNNAAYLSLQNTCQVVYNQIPANATDIQYIVNVTCLNSLSNLQQAKNSIIQTSTILEYLLYLIGVIIIILTIIKLMKKINL